MEIVAIKILKKHCSLKHVKHVLFFPSKPLNFIINLMHTILQLQETTHLNLSFCLKENYLPESLHTWPSVTGLLKSITKLKRRFPVLRGNVVLFYYTSGSKI